MPVHADPIASLTSWPVELVVAGREYTLPAKPATDWLIALIEDFGSFVQLIDMLTIEEKAEIELAVIEGQVEDGELERVFRDAAEAVAGRPWWVVINYLNLLQGAWPRFHGRILSSGLDPSTISLGAYLDAAHYAFIEGREDSAIQKITNFLETPPPGFSIELDEESEGETFLAMLNQGR